MSKLKQKYPTKKKAQEASRDDDSIDLDDQTDGDIIRCVCDDSDDDGFTIQCEHCENWQHASCVNVKKNNIPEHYMCDRCSKKLNRKDNQNRRRNSSSETDKKMKPKKLVKRNIPKKHGYHQDSEDEESENHHVPPTISKTKFTPLSKNVFKEKLVEHLLVEVHRQWMESNKTRSSNTKGKLESPSTSSAAAKGLESIVVMESNLLLPAIPKASVKPLRKSLRGSFLQNQKDPSVEKGVFADIHIPEHRYLMEVTGEYARKSEYKSDPENNYTLLATPPAHVFFFRAFDICIDARFAGNDTRYIRRSCSPNSEIRSIILPNDNDDQSIHMGIYTSEEVDRGEEITIGWNWHRGYLMWTKNKEFLRQKHKIEINPSEIDTLKQSLSLIASEFGECACEDKEECLIECLKDELEKQTDDQYTADNDNSNGNPLSNKRKRLSNTNKLRIDNESHKKIKKGAPRASDIFSSDEENKSKSRRNSASSNKEEHKQVKLIKKGTSRRKPVHAPTSPTVSQGDSVDIDILSMSPLPSQPTSENESESQTSKYKLPRPFVEGDIRLPCKKRWLYQYLSEQREKQQQQGPQQEPQQQQDQVEALSEQTEIEKVEEIPYNNVQLETKHVPTSPNVIKENTTRDTYHNLDQDDSSDGASSDSTLPLEDTPKIKHDEKGNLSDQNSTANTNLPQQEDQQELSSNATIVDNDMKPDSITHNEPESSSAVGQSDANKQIENKMEEVKQAKKKLTLQEYLLMRRGNLPTPDEKHASTE